MNEPGPRRSLRCTAESLEQLLSVIWVLDRHQACSAVGGSPRCSPPVPAGPFSARQYSCITLGSERRGGTARKRPSHRRSSAAAAAAAAPGLLAAAAASKSAWRRQHLAWAPSCAHCGITRQGQRWVAGRAGAADGTGRRWCTLRALPERRRHAPGLPRFSHSQILPQMLPNPDESAHPLLGPHLQSKIVFMSEGCQRWAAGSWWWAVGARGGAVLSVAFVDC